MNPPQSITTVPKDTRYIRLPYQGNHSFSIRDKLQSNFRRLYPQVDFKFIFTNSYTIKSFFPHKDRLPDSLRSKIIYKFTCEACEAFYIGSTKRSLHQRSSEHKGISFLTGNPLTSLSPSSIRAHAHKHKHPINTEDFKIIGSVRDEMDLRTLESLFIREQKPSLNDMSSAAILYIT